MPRHIALIAALVLILTVNTWQMPNLASPVAEALAAPAIAESTTDARAALAAETAPAFSGPSAYAYVDALATQIGSRAVGSPNQARAQQYLADQYRALGYQVELQPFTVTSYEDRGSALTLVGPLGRGMTATTLQYSTSGDVQAELVEAGLGRPEDFEDAGVAGKIALVGRGDIRFQEKAEAATRAGALAVIIFNNQAGTFSGSLLGPSSIPVVGISQSDGQELRQAIRAGRGTARVTVDAGMSTGTASNVVATRPGGSRTIVIGGHFDSVAAGPGANDNGSGTAVALELARVLAQSNTPFTLKFVGFDAEEIGLLGSRHYVEQLSEAERRSIVAMVNLDMVGVGNETRLGGTPGLVDAARRAAVGLGESVGSMGEAPGASDHASFLNVGIPSIFVYRSNDPNYHSPEDKAQYIDPANLEQAGRIVLGLVSSLERSQ
jgi:Zn-dependent M28 family amino/carboxypeptidase